MSTYKDIQGNLIPVLSSDPSNLEFGDIWYNSTSSSLKAYQYVSVWSTGANYPQGLAALGGAGTQTAGLAFGGQFNSPPNVLRPRNIANKYDGTSYSATGSLGTARRLLGGFGTQTAAVATGGTTGPGNSVASTENFTGTSWAASGNLPYVKSNANQKTYGTQTAGVMLGSSGGFPYPSPPYGITTLNYNGSSWSTGVSLPANFGPAASKQGFGTQTAGVAINQGPNGLGTSVEFNGSTWGSTAYSNVMHFDGHTSGTQTAGLYATGTAGGRSYTLIASETYDGTTWSNAGNCNTGRSQMASAGASPSSLSLMMAGSPSNNTNGGSTATEEWEQAIKTVTFTSS